MLGSGVRATDVNLVGEVGGVLLFLLRKNHTPYPRPRTHRCPNFEREKSSVTWLEPLATPMDTGEGCWSHSRAGNVSKAKRGKIRQFGAFRECLRAQLPFHLMWKTEEHIV